MTISQPNTRIQRPARAALVAALLATTAFATAPPATAGDLILNVDFENGTNNATIATGDGSGVDSTVFSTAAVPSFPDATAFYSNLQSVSGSMSLVVQDSTLAAGNSPELFWNLGVAGVPLDQTRVLKYSYWHYANDTTLQPGKTTLQAAQSPVQHMVLTASDADKTRPEGNGSYFASSWNWVSGPTSPPGNYDYYGDVDTGVFPQNTATVSSGAWYKVENYLPLIPFFEGSALYQGALDVNDLDGDNDTTEYLGYIDKTGRSFDTDPNNDRDPDVNNFYSRVFNAAGDVLGTNPYMTHRGDPDEGVTVRALQLFEGGTDFATSFFDDIHFEYVNTADIDAMVHAIFNDTTNEDDYDFNFDGVVDDDDTMYFVETVLQSALGDFDLDYRVDENDLLTMDANWLATNVSYADGDLNGDNVVNGMDLAILQSRYGHTFTGDTPVALTYGEALALTTNIPQPASIALLAAGAALTTTRHRHRQQTTRQRRAKTQA